MAAFLLLLASSSSLCWTASSSSSFSSLLFGGLKICADWTKEMGDDEKTRTMKGGALKQTRKCSCVTFIFCDPGRYVSYTRRKAC